MFKVSAAVGREHAFVLTVFKIMQNLEKTCPATVSIDFDKLGHFLKAIQRGYRQKVTYHNDLHGADVAQMLYLMIKQGQLA